MHQRHKVFVRSKQKSTRIVAYQGFPIWLDILLGISLRTYNEPFKVTKSLKEALSCSLRLIHVMESTKVVTAHLLIEEVNIAQSSKLRHAFVQQIDANLLFDVKGYTIYYLFPSIDHTSEIANIVHTPSQNLISLPSNANFSYCR
ncbi:hypothetical protein ACET3Z_001194 [Daucus carota]